MLVSAIVGLALLGLVGGVIWLRRRSQRNQAQTVALQREAITPAAWVAAGWWSDILTEALNDPDPDEGTSWDQGRRSLSAAGIDLFRRTLSDQITEAYLRSVGLYHEPHAEVRGDLTDGTLSAAAEAAGIVWISSLLPRMSMTVVYPDRIKIMGGPGDWATVPVT